MIFTELRKREVPFNVLQYYDSLARGMNMETRHHSIIVLPQFAEKLGDLVRNEAFYFSQFDNVYCYDMDKEQIQEFINLMLPRVFQSQDGTFYGEDLRKLRKR